ncbi:SsgA family sporulation/cell division regulator [Kitasatospora sp. NPDC004614]|uniref:SsgA family sporulation/cell division regulator n=1 Tax=unclassified Kitasatospora TaxID=2633591 RepID=UPI003673958B
MSAPHPLSDPQPEAISTDLALDAQIVLGEHQSIAVPVRLGYCADDPYAVALEFLGQASEAGVWQFSRDLLWEGLQKPTGLGDVRVWPPCPCHGRTELRIMLQGDDGSVLLDLPARQIRRWLRRDTFSLVPPGTEGTRIDWDTELHTLTG